MKFVVKGAVPIGGVKKGFEREVEADNEEAARDKVLALFGSEHGAKRRQIDIESVSKAKA